MDKVTRDLITVLKASRLSHRDAEKICDTGKHSITSWVRAQGVPNEVQIKQMVRMLRAWIDEVDDRVGQLEDNLKAEEDDDHGYDDFDKYQAPRR